MLRQDYGEHVMIDLKPWGSLNCPNLEESGVYVMGVPFDGAVSIGKGAAQAPDRLRDLSRYMPPTTEEGKIIDKLAIFDAGDVPVDLNWERYFKLVEDEGYKGFDADKFCLFIGGDHSVTIPLHRAFKRKYEYKKIGIIHFDSHSDLCDEYDGHRWSHACTERRAVDDIIGWEDLALVGIRSWEPDEVEYLNKNPALVITANELFLKGYEAACQKLREKFNGYDAIYFSLDIDVIDPSGAPGTGTPEAGGPSSREVLEMVKRIYDDLPVRAMDIVEVSPPLDAGNEITSWAALKIIYEVFGKLCK